VAVSIKALNIKQQLYIVLSCTSKNILISESDEHIEHFNRQQS